ncbi:MAG: PLP-dependent transferase, partial [Proteobacteria bacterium]|nr:PLP-dependent transferase [Pseudomonadota bacterium]
LASDYASAKAFVSNTRIFQRAVSVGAVESLIEQPASMSHASYDRTDRLKAGIDDGLIRLSIGLEDVEDLLDDLKEAIKSSVPTEKPAGLIASHRELPHDLRIF